MKCVHLHMCMYVCMYVRRYVCILYISTSYVYTYREGLCCLLQNLKEGAVMCFIVYMCNIYIYDLQYICISNVYNVPRIYAYLQSMHIYVITHTYIGMHAACMRHSTGMRACVHIHILTHIYSNYAYRNSDDSSLTVYVQNTCATTLTISWSGI